jgi:hypothetical protein
MSFFVVQGYELNPFTGRPDNSLPGYGRPDNSLPGGPPATPGWGGGWGSGNRPDNSLPRAPRDGRANNTLPGGGHPWLPGHGDGGVSPDNALPGQAAPKGAAGTAVASAPPEKVDPTKGGWLLVFVPSHGLIWAWGQPPAPPASTKPPTTPTTPPATPKA